MAATEEIQNPCNLAGTLHFPMPTIANFQAGQVYYELVGGWNGVYVSGGSSHC